MENTMTMDVCGGQYHDNGCFLVENIMNMDDD